MSTKKIGLFDATLLVSGSMIGSGIFIVSADMARTIGNSYWLLILWLISGIITLLAALAYGELAALMPDAGGQYVYIKNAYNKLIAFLYGWTVFTVIQTGVIAAVAVAFAKFLGVLFPSISNDFILLSIGNWHFSTLQFTAIASIVLLTFINIQGLQSGIIIQRVFTAAKLIALFGLIVFGIYYGINHDNFNINFNGTWQITRLNENNIQQLVSGMAISSVLGIAIIGPLFSSDAWNNVTFIAGDIENPKRNLPLSLILGTSIVTVIYLLANIAYLGILPLNGSASAIDVVGQGIQFANQDRVGSAAAQVLLGNNGYYIMAVLIVVSTFGCNNGLIMSGARLFKAMADDGLFFKKASVLSKKKAPNYALVIQGAWASLLCISGSYGDLLDYSTFASLLFYIVTIAGIFILRKKWKNHPRTYRAVGYPVLPILYILIALFICINLLVFKGDNAFKGLLLVAIGIPIYYLTVKKNN